MRHLELAGALALNAAIATAGAAAVVAFLIYDHLIGART